MTKIIIVRHCQAEGNLKRFFQGSIDSDITETGRAQIAAVSELLAAEPIDVIYTTPLRRARLTAGGINLDHEVLVRIEPRLSEIDAGEWEGRLLTDIEKEYPEQFYNWRNNSGIFQAPGGESMVQVYERTGAAISDILKNEKGKTVCVVSHGCAIKTIMCRIQGLDISEIDKVPIGTNVSLNVIVFDDDNKPEILMNNYSDHVMSIR